MMMQNVSWLPVLAALLGACSSGDDDDGGSNTSALAESCHRQCDAQSSVPDCMPPVELEFCKALCDSSARDLPSECATQYSSYYDCAVETGYQCSDGYVTQTICDTPGAPCSDGCSTLARALGTCQGFDMECDGADADGSCAPVDCPCESGTVSISGVTYESGSCACVDATTCLDLC